MNFQKAALDELHCTHLIAMNTGIWIYQE